MNHALREPNGRWTVTLRRYRVALGLAAVVLLLWAGTAVAAEVAGGDTYHLPRGEVVADDLYVSGDEVIIDGTVNGDLVAAGGYVEVNGVVTGDLIAVGGAVVVNGAVQDDARLAGGGIIVAGSVGDDLFVAGGGGGWPGAFAIPMTIGKRTLPQGIQLMPQAAVSGDAYLAGGQGTLAGSVGGDLWVGMGAAVFTGHVAGDATLNAQTLTVGDAAQVQGTLTTSSANAVAVPEGVAAAVRQEAVKQGAAVETPRNPVVSALWWLLRTVLLLLGLAVIGWVVWRLAPRAIAGPAAVMEERPVVAALYGLLAAVAVLPLSAALVFLAILVWNWFPGGVVMAAFTFGLSALVWLVSPVVTGLWLGRKLSAALGIVRGDLATLLLGIATIVVVGRLIALIPCVGDLTSGAIYMLSFALAVGSCLLARQRPAALVVAAEG